MLLPAQAASALSVLRTCGNRAIARQPERISVWASGINARLLTLSLFVVGVLGANNHNLAVALDDLAFIAHRLNRRSDFHDGLL